MIVDFHTHLFPPGVLANRDAYLARDSTFRELYGSPKAQLATAEDLLRSMDAARIDISIALGFAWRDLDDCRRHNDYLLEASTKSAGRIVAICTLPLAAGPDAIVEEAARCIATGAAGFGELRPDSLDCDLNTPEVADALTQAASHGHVILFHVSEPAGHPYPGKHGLDLAAFYRFVHAHPELRIVGAHWGGGLPFYALMPEVKAALGNVSVDTAGTSLLYTPQIYTQVAGLVGPEKILFGSDFPLLSQARSRRRIEEESGFDYDAIALILGENARALLALD